MTTQNDLAAVPLSTTPCPDCFGPRHTAVGKLWCNPACSQWGVPIDDEPATTDVTKIGEVESGRHLVTLLVTTTVRPSLRYSCSCTRTFMTAWTDSPLHRRMLRSAAIAHAETP